MSWQDTELKFGKYKGMTMGELAKKNPRYIEWMYLNIDNEKLKKAAALALKYLAGEDDTEVKEPATIMIKFLREVDKFPNGMLAVKVTGEYKETFEELHPCCRAWDVQGGFWRVPVAIFGDILAKFPDAKLSKDLWYMCLWTRPTKLERNSEPIIPKKK